MRKKPGTGGVVSASTAAVLLSRGHGRFGRLLSATPALMLLLLLLFPERKRGKETVGATVRQRDGKINDTRRTTSRPAAAAAGCRAPRPPRQSRTGSRSSADAACDWRRAAGGGHVVLED
ncbi:MAG: hypothetical protein AAFO91_11235 [Bacteroidota bacterium]